MAKLPGHKNPAGSKFKSWSVRKKTKRSPARTLTKDESPSDTDERPEGDSTGGMLEGRIRKESLLLIRQSMTCFNVSIRSDGFLVYSPGFRIVTCLRFLSKYRRSDKNLLIQHNLSVARVIYDEVIKIVMHNLKIKLNLLQDASYKHCDMMESYFTANVICIDQSFVNLSNQRRLTSHDWIEK